MAQPGAFTLYNDMGHLLADNEPPEEVWDEAVKSVFMMAEPPYYARFYYRKMEDTSKTFTDANGVNWVANYSPLGWDPEKLAQFNNHKNK